MLIFFYMYCFIFEGGGQLQLIQTIMSKLSKRLGFSLSQLEASKPATPLSSLWTMEVDWLLTHFSYHPCPCICPSMLPRSCISHRTSTWSTSFVYKSCNRLAYADSVILVCSNVSQTGFMTGILDGILEIHFNQLSKQALESSLKIKKVKNVPWWRWCALD